MEIPIGPKLKTLDRRGRRPQARDVLLRPRGGVLSVLKSWSKSKTSPSLRLRARIILEFRKNGVSATYAQVAEALGVSETTVGVWRRRFIESLRAYNEGRTKNPLDEFGLIIDRAPRAAMRRAQALLRRGLSTRVVAREVGASQSKIARLRKRILNPA